MSFRASRVRRSPLSLLLEWAASVRAGHSVGVSLRLSCGSAGVVALRRVPAGTRRRAVIRGVHSRRRPRLIGATGALFRCRIRRNRTPFGTVLRSLSRGIGAGQDAVVIRSAYSLGSPLFPIGRISVLSVRLRSFRPFRVGTRRNAVVRSVHLSRRLFSPSRRILPLPRNAGWRHIRISAWLSLRFTVTRRRFPRYGARRSAIIKGRRTL